MNSKHKWHSIDETDGWRDVIPPPPPPPPTHHRRLRRLGWAVGGLLVTGVALCALYVAWTYRSQLKEVNEPVLRVAQLEAQAIRAGDSSLFMALQDPDDQGWRDVQAHRFGRLEHLGLPELGWQAVGAPPEAGAVTLEPGGARLDMIYRFSVTQALPGAAVTVTLRLPQFYRPTPDGWVRAMPFPDFWGRPREARGRRVTMTYFQRDAELVEPFLLHLDKLIEHLCASLACPAEMKVSFENSAQTLMDFSYLTYRINGDTLTIAFPSPHLLGLPADDSSRDELYRALQEHLVWVLIHNASQARLALNPSLLQAVMDWELARAGLSALSTDPEMTRTLSATLQLGVWYPLEAIMLDSRQGAPDQALEVFIPFAVSFVEKRFGPGAVARLAAAISYSLTLDEAIEKTFDVNLAMLNLDWWVYLREQAGAPLTDTAPSNGGLSNSAPPGGELGLGCGSRLRGYSIWQINTDGSGLEQMEQDAQSLIWSLDGQRYAYIHPEDAVAAPTTPTMETREIGWLPDGRLWGLGDNWVIGPDGLARKDKISLIDPASRQVLQITGTAHLWSPDGSYVAYLDSQTLALLVADTEGGHRQQVAPGWITAPDVPSTTIRIAPGYPMAWSPDSRQLAFAGRLVYEVPGSASLSLVNEVRVVDVSQGSQRLLLHMGLDRSFIDSLAWSPDGSRLAVTVHWPDRTHVTLVSADTGTVRARLQGEWADLALPYDKAWSPDSRYLVVKIAQAFTPLSPRPALMVWDTLTDQHTTLPGLDWAWSPQGDWLAVVQKGSGITWSPEGGWLPSYDASSVLLITPDLSAMRRLEAAPDCSYITWRPPH